MTGGLFHVSYSFSLAVDGEYIPRRIDSLKDREFHHHVTRTVTDMNTYDAPIWRY